jgi:hypothetical protein
LRHLFAMVISLPLISFLSTWKLFEFINRKFGKRAVVTTSIVVLAALAAVACKFLIFQSDGTVANQASVLTSVLVVGAVASCAIGCAIFMRE